MQCKHNNPSLNAEHEPQDLDHEELAETIGKVKKLAEKLHKESINDLTRELEILTSSIAQTAETAHQELQDSVDAIKQNIDEISEQLDTDVSAVNNRVADAVTTLNSSVNAAENRVNARMDNIIANSSSTEGNSELIDIRTGADSVVYHSAGAAVRGQIHSSNNYMNYLKNRLGIWKVNLLELYHASENATTGYYIQYNNGILRENQDYFATDFIPISGGQTYISNANNYEQGAFYDSNKTYISGYTKINTPVQAPQNACYIRMSFKNFSSVLPWKLYQSDTLPDNDFTAGAWFSTPVSDLYNKSQTTDAMFLRNLIGQEFTDNYYVRYSDGNIISAESYCYSSYIEVYPETDYFCNVNAHVAFYDSSKTFLSGTLINQSNPEYATGNIKTPSDCCFMIISFMINKKPSAMLSYGDTEKEYIAVGKVKIDGLVVDLPNTIIVDINGNGNYSSISSAVENAKNGDTIYIMSGIYNETIAVPHNKKINFIGQNKLDTIIKNNSGNYVNCPILMGAGKLENLTVYAQKDEQTDTNAQDYDGRAYAVHIERDSLYHDTLYIKNCILKSDFYPALGMGMRGGCTVVLEDTDFILGSTAGGTAALYVHDADNANYTGLQNLTIRHCRIINYRTNADRYAIKLQSQERNGTLVKLTMQNVLTRSFGGSNLPLEIRNYYNGTSTDSDDFQGLINWRLSDSSYGNSYDIFNFIMP